MNRPADYNWAAEVMAYAMANPAGVARRRAPKASRPVRSAPATVQAPRAEPAPEPLAVEAPAAPAEPVEAEPVPVPDEPVSQVRSIRPGPANPPKTRPSPSAKLSLSDASKAFARTKWGTFEAEIPEQWAQSVCRAKSKNLAVGFFAFDEPVRVSAAKLKAVLQCRKNWVSWSVEFRSHDNQQTLELKWFNRYGGRGGMKFTDQPFAEFEAIAIGEAEPEAIAA